MNHDHCECRPIVCGPHVIKPCAVSVIQQVMPATGMTGRRYILRARDMGDQAMFVMEDDIKPLLEYWSLPVPGGLHTREVANRYGEKRIAREDLGVPPTGESGVPRQ